MKFMSILLVFSFSLAVVAAEAPLVVTGDLYRKGQEWHIMAALDNKAARRRQFRLLDLSLDKNFTRSRIFGQIEAVPTKCSGTLPCLRVKSFTPVLSDPLSAKQ